MHGHGRVRSREPRAGELCERRSRGVAAFGAPYFLYLLAVVTQSSHALICKVKDVNELAGPGRGVTVIKVPAGDEVIAFLCASDKEQSIELESSKGGRKLSLGVKTYELAARGGKGREMVKKDKVKVVQRQIAFVPLPEQKGDK